VFVIFPGTRASFAVLEGIRGALIQTRAVKSVRGAPPRAYYLGTSIGSFVHAADELHHAASPRGRAARPSSTEKEISTAGTYGSAVAREKSGRDAAAVIVAHRLLRKHAVTL